eukprot:scaffold105543_cov30-Tisochrysis_lutea.AAC.4
MAPLSAMSRSLLPALALRLRACCASCNAVAWASAASRSFDRHLALSSALGSSYASARPGQSYESSIPMDNKSCPEARQTSSTWSTPSPSASSLPNHIGPSAPTGRQISHVTVVPSVLPPTRPGAPSAAASLPLRDCHHVPKACASAAALGPDRVWGTQVAQRHGPSTTTKAASAEGDGNREPPFLRAHLVSVAPRNVHTVPSALNRLSHSEFAERRRQLGGEVGRVKIHVVRRGETGPVSLHPIEGAESPRHPLHLLLTRVQKKPALLAAEQAVDNLRLVIVHLGGGRAVGDP